METAPVDYEISDDTHRRFVAALRGLPPTMTWSEIDALRHEEQRKQFIEAHNLSEETSWETIHEINVVNRAEKSVRNDERLAKEIDAALSNDISRVSYAVWFGLDEDAGWQEIQHFLSYPEQVEQFQIDRLRRLLDISYLKEMWENSPG